jgi:hypothetical protein
METMVTHPHDAQVKTASGLNFLAGIWLIISPWIYGVITGNNAASNSVVVGIIIAVLAAIRFFAPRNAVGLSWINALLGIWMIISPWIYGYAGHTGWLWNSVIVGIIAVVLALWSAAGTRRDVVAP